MKVFHKFTFRADGDANFYTVFKDENWFAKIQFNGELTTHQQEAFARRIVNIAIDDEVNAELEARGITVSTEDGSA